MADLRIEVVYATPSRQSLLEVSVAQGTKVGEAIAQSGICDLHPEIDCTEAPVGIFGQRVPLDTEVRSGDRVEIYRPLIMDPKEARRQRAKRGAS